MPHTVAYAAFVLIVYVLGLLYTPFTPLGVLFFTIVGLLSVILFAVFWGA